MNDFLDCKESANAIEETDLLAMVIARFDRGALGRMLVDGVESLVSDDETNAFEFSDSNTFAYESL